MRTTIGCLVILLTCSCSQLAHKSNPGTSEATMRRQEEVRQIVFGQSSAGIGCEIRGPLTIGQVREEFDRFDAQREEDENRMINDIKDENIRRYYESRRVQMMDTNGVSLRFKESGWSRFESTYKEGGVIYYVKSGPQSWRELLGTEMYVVIRKNKVTNWIIISMN